MTNIFYKKSALFLYPTIKILTQVTTNCKLFIKGGYEQSLLFVTFCVKLNHIRIQPILMEIATNRVILLQHEKTSNLL